MQRSRTIKATIDDQRQIISCPSAARTRRPTTVMKMWKSIVLLNVVAWSLVAISGASGAGKELAAISPQELDDLFIGEGQRTLKIIKYLILSSST